MVGTVIDQINECLREKKNFVLSGGAGSGKTYTLIQTLNSVFEANAAVKVACITYTRVSADEIRKRSPYTNLWVSTIHEFLWHNIKGYKKDLKKAVLSLLEEERKDPKSGLSYSGEIEIDENTFEFIDYKNYRKLEEGIISHDDLLIIAEYMFRRYPLLSKILCDKYDYILIDEYQDTQLSVKNIFLEHIKEKATGKLCVGFFGDKMQSIYDSGIVDIHEFIESGGVREIIKEDNYRCSTEVIALLNKIRTDIIQKPAKEDEEGNIINKTGSITFLYSKNEFDLADFKQMPLVSQWDFDNPKNTKLLFLTHRLIANRSGWGDILSAYKNSDMLLGDQPDRLASHLLKLGEILYFYKQKDYSKVVNRLDMRIKTISDKSKISKLMSEFTSNEGYTIGEAIDKFDNERLLRKDDKFNEYIEANSERYEDIKKFPLSQAVALFKYQNDFSPYSTQHGIKGAEFDNVLVVMDNGKWSKYNFNYYFESKVGKESIIERTERIFYVCCSRSMSNLVVYYQNPTPIVIYRAKHLFGDENVVEV
jgi:DNA helicase-2/ATP-dependent DNA helicase PcrA